ncbi:MAG: hypothetical protein ACREE9_16835 [Stellaceae bacterium]
MNSATAGSRDNSRPSGASRSRRAPFCLTGHARWPASVCRIIWKPDLDHRWGAQWRVAADEEVLRFIDRQALFGRGIGYVGAHLLAAARLTSGARLWTHDRRLHAVAAELGLAAKLSH